MYVKLNLVVCPKFHTSKHQVLSVIRIAGVGIHGVVVKQKKKTKFNIALTRAQSVVRYTLGFALESFSRLAKLATRTAHIPSRERSQRSLLHLSKHSVVSVHVHVVYDRIRLFFLIIFLLIASARIRKTSGHERCTTCPRQTLCSVMCISIQMLLLKLPTRNVVCRFVSC